MPKYWKSKTILGKVEANYGTDPALSGAANAILGQDVTFSPMEGEVVTRNVDRTYFGAKPILTTAYRSVLTFSVSLVGSGTAGTAPAWGPLLRMCAVAEVITAGTKVEYSPITDSPESGALYFDVDGTKHLMLGTRGTAVFTVNANAEPVIKFTLTSLFTIPAEAAKPVANYAGWMAPQVGASSNTPVFTIGGQAFAMRNFELDLGLEVKPRNLIGSNTIRITDRNSQLSTQVEAVALTTYDPFTIAKSGTLQPIALEHGTTAGRKVRFDLLSCQQQLPTYQEQDNILEWPLKFAVLPASGNDEWKITLT